MSKPSYTTVLYVHSSDEMYGADLILLELVTGLDPQVFRPIVVLPTDLPFDGMLSQALREHGITVLHTNLAVLRRSYFRPFSFLLYLWRFVCSVAFLIKLMCREHIDIVHSNTLAVLPGAVAAWLTQTRHVWHVHEIIINPRFLWRLTSWLAAHLADQVVAVSSPTRQHLCAGNARLNAKSVVIHNGIDLQKFDANRGMGEGIRREWNVAPDELLVGMIGRFSHWKGHNYLLLVAEQVVARYSNVKFAFVGGTIAGQTAFYDDFVERVSALGLQERIVISGYRGDVPAVLDAYNLFVLPSILPDPLPTVVLEAMAMAKPVVANAHGGSMEMVEHGVTGFLVDPDNLEMMVNAILLLLEQPQLRMVMGSKGRQRVGTQFSIETFIARWTALYRSL